MPLKELPSGLLKPYTREGVTSRLKKTAMNTALIKKAIRALKILKDRLAQAQTEEEAEELIGDIELLALEIQGWTQANRKEIAEALLKAERYYKAAR